MNWFESVNGITLTEIEQQILAGQSGQAAALALRVVLRTAEILGAHRLVKIESAHIDGCLYHGDSGVYFLEKLVGLGGQVAVHTTLNVGSVDLGNPSILLADIHAQTMGRRLMSAHTSLGCLPTWTCAPYQVNHRPEAGQQVAWGESNAVVFANSVLGARTNRYGDFLDICMAICARAPYVGLHLKKNRRAKIVIDTCAISSELKNTESFYPVLGAWLGREVGDTVAAIDGLPPTINEDSLKALGAGAAATGSVGLFHIVGVTPEAPDLDSACQQSEPEQTIKLTAEMICNARDRLDTADGSSLDCIALGSPHFSERECRELCSLLAQRCVKKTIYVCTNRTVYDALNQDKLIELLQSLGVVFVIDTCVVVTPILKGQDGVMMTNSAKFAHYGKGNTGFDTIFGSLAECVESAVAGRVQRSNRLWQ